MKSAQQALFAYFVMLRNIYLEIVLQVIGDNATDLLENIMVLSIIFRPKIHICHNMLVFYIKYYQIAIHSNESSFYHDKINHVVLFHDIFQEL